MNSPKTAKLDVAKLMRQTRILTGGLSRMTGVKVVLGDSWRIDLKRKVLVASVPHASLLSESGRRGVIVHENAHAVFTKDIDYEKLLPPDEQRHVRHIHHLMNCMEDRRIELRMAQRYPGFEEDFANLHRDALSAEVDVMLASAPAFTQFQYLVHRRAYGLPEFPAMPEVVALVNKHTDTIMDCVAADTTRQMFDLAQQSGMIADLIDLGENPPDGGGDEDGEDGEPGEGQEGEGGSQGSSDASADPDGSEGSEGEAESSDGDSAESEGESGGASESGDSAPSSGSFKPLEEALASLTSDERERLSDLVDEMRNDVDTPSEVYDALEAVKDALDDVAAAEGNVAAKIEAAKHDPKLDREDQQHGNPGNPDDAKRVFDEAQKKWSRQASVLSRALESVLRENSFDRLSSIGFESGPKLHPRKLALLKAGDTRVFRRKERPRNRRYAVAILLDHSGSMSGPRLDVSREALIMVTRALEKANIEVALYSFHSQNRLLKSYRVKVADRAVPIGSLKGQGGTQLCPALRRAGSEMLAEYDDSWRKLVIAITDGQSAGDVRAEVRALEAADIDVVGVGIGMDLEAYLAHCFGDGTAVAADAGELSKLLPKVLRKHIRRG
jgi:uncharacterized protein with von Willebrand factor type A (vWA) domain